jgi:hypothetical protein
MMCSDVTPTPWSSRPRLLPPPSWTEVYRQLQRKCLRPPRVDIHHYDWKMPPQPTCILADCQASLQLTAEARAIAYPALVEMS